MNPTVADFDDITSTAVPGTASVHSTERRNAQVNPSMWAASECYRRLNAVEQEVATLKRLLHLQTEATVRLREKLRDTRATLRVLRGDLTRLDDSLRALYVLVQGMNRNIAQIREHVGLTSSTECLVTLRTV